MTVCRDIAQFEIRPSKIVDYLLAIDHREGGPKARFFLARGFRVDDPQALADALADHAMRCWPGTPLPAPYGLKHRIIGPLPCPDGSTATILAIWKVGFGSAAASLVTAYPD